MDYQNIITNILDEQLNLEAKGVLPSYIPELNEINPDKLGIHLITVDKQNYFAGDSNQKFSIQSISKVFSLSTAEPPGANLKSID